MRAFLMLAALAASLPAQESYPLGPDSRRQAGVPQGAVTKHTWTSRIFPGTVRDYWVYVPAQYKPDKPACVMIFQDGGGWVGTDEKSRFRAPIVMDNLIHKGEMPVTVGIFLNPGVLPPLDGATQMGRYNRSFEYDALGDRYARFLIEEILPEVGKSYNLSSNPDDRGLAGSSSGGIAAFTAAWERPDAFRRVISYIGSYTNLRGGQIYPSLIRKVEPKPLRIYLQDGSRDQNIYAGNWWIANQDMASALQYAGYEVHVEWGTEGHNGIHGSALLPEALRWLWRGHPAPVEASRAAGERHMVNLILDPASEWEEVSRGHGFTEGPAVDREGNVYFTDVRGDKIFRIDHAAGKASLWKDKPGRIVGMMFGPDGRLYATKPSSKQVVAYTMDGVEQVVAEGIEGNDLAVTAKGEIYVTEPAAKKVWFADGQGRKRVVAEGFEFANGVVLSPDQSLVMVADSRTKWVWSYQRAADGSLENGQAFYRLETPDDSPNPGADGMTVDTEGHLYVATRAGLQICDAPGRVVAILNKPHAGALSNAVFAGPGLDWIYVTAGDRVYRRHLRRRGVNAWTPVKPPQPRL
jgi:sugar lactone lactonase YvrE/enterochelin esterase-like enzyme